MLTILTFFDAFVLYLFNLSLNQWDELIDRTNVR